MKKSAAKTLGAAALGAAFVAAAAGSASAAVPAIGLSDALGTVTGAAQGLTSQQQVSPAGGQQQSDPAAPSTSSPTRSARPSAACPSARSAEADPRLIGPRIRPRIFVRARTWRTPVRSGVCHVVACATITTNCPPTHWV